MTAQPSINGDEIDLRVLARRILARWLWIVIGTAVAAIGALVVSLIQPKQYQASASLLTIEQQAVSLFESRGNVRIDAPNGRVVKSIALDAEALDLLFEHPSVAALDLTAAERSAVRQNLAVTVSDTIQLNVKGEEPGKLIVLANTWAEVVSQFVNDLYLPDASEHMFLVDQTEEALKDWQDSQQALIEFENVSLVLILRDRLIAEEAELNRYYATQRELNTVLQDLGVLQERLKDQDPESVAQVRDSTAALILSLRATSHSSASFIAVELDESTEGFLLEPSSSINLQIQTGVDSLKGETVEDLIASLDEIIDSIRSYISDLDDSAAELSDGILELQGKIEEIQTSRSRLELVEDQAETVYSALSLRAQEISLMVESQQPILAIASHAVLPAKVVGPDVIVNTAIAGILGFAIAILWVILVEWWRGADAHKENG